LNLVDVPATLPRFGNFVWEDINPLSRLKRIIWGGGNRGHAASKLVCAACTLAALAPLESTFTLIRLVAASMNRSWTSAPDYFGGIWVVRG
jgi:hypothetical protein